MYLFHLMALVALSGALTAPLAAQGIPRNAQRTTVTMAPRFMVANPFAFVRAGRFRAGRRDRHRRP